MKPFYGVDLTNDKHNLQHNGKEFLTATPSPALMQAFDDAGQTAAQRANAALLPLWLRIIQTVAGAYCLIVVLSVMRNLYDISLEAAFANAPWIFISAGICFVVWGILQLMSMGKKKRVLDTEEQKRLQRNLQTLQDNILAELGVPQNAAQLDVLSMGYKTKKDKLKPCVTGMRYAAYQNRAFRSYCDGENLYLVNLQGKYSFPLAGLTKLRTVNKSLSFTGWHKTAGPTEKPYKLNMNQYGVITCKPYYVLELEYRGESWGILLPGYEKSVITELTGLQAQQ